MSDSVNESSIRIKRENNFPVVLLYLYLHTVGIISPFIIKNAFLSTYVFAILLIFLGFIGATAGAHRLWAHRTYAASLKLRIFLMICFAISGQGTIYNWVLEHRLHHKYFGTKLDPFNYNKSIFNLQTLSRVTKPAGGYDKLAKIIDMSDIENDGVVMFQKKYYLLLYICFALLLPINAPGEYWGETISNCAVLIAVLRYLITTHLISMIETSPKILGCNYNIEENNDKKLVSTIDKKDWITYHYIASWDYQAGEFGSYGNDMISTFIRFCETLGQASSLKTMEGHIIGQALQMSRDNNRPILQCLTESNFIDARHSKFKQSHSLN